MMIGHGVLDVATGIQILVLSIYPQYYEMLLSF